MATCAEEDASAATQLSAMFPNLEWDVSCKVLQRFTNHPYYILQFILSVLQNHGGCVEPAVHYLVAVLGDPEDVPVSDDIGGLPQVLQDQSFPDSDGESASSPTNSIVVDIEDASYASSSEECGDTTADDSLPTYNEVTGRLSPAPPSYDTLIHTPTAKASSPSKQKVKLAYKIRTKGRKKLGYCSLDT